MPNVIRISHFDRVGDNFGFDLSQHVLDEVGFVGQ